MKAIIGTHTTIFLSLIALASCGPSHGPKADSADCLAQMSEETTAYIRNTKIPLTGADAEFYANREEQVYLVNSEEAVRLDPKESAKKPVAVINHKEPGGKRSFYLIEQEVAADKITFILSKDSKVLESLPISLVLPRPSIPGTGGSPCQNSCDTINADNNAQIQALQAEANQTCSSRGICLPFCRCVGGTQSLEPTLYRIDPTAWRCWITTTEVKYHAFHFWAGRQLGPFLAQAFDTAVIKQAGRFVY